MDPFESGKSFGGRVGERVRLELQADLDDVEGGDHEAVPGVLALLSLGRVFLLKGLELGLPGGLLTVK